MHGRHHIETAVARTCDVVACARAVVFLAALLSLFKHRWLLVYSMIGCGPEAFTSCYCCVLQRQLVSIVCYDYSSSGSTPENLEEGGLLKPT